MAFIESTVRLTEEELRKLLDLRLSQTVVDAERLIDEKLPAETDSVLITSQLSNDPRARADSFGNRVVEIHFRLAL